MKTAILPSRETFLSLFQNNLKYITPSKGSRYNPHVNIEPGNDTVRQLYNLTEDAGEKNNLAEHQSALIEILVSLLEKIKTSGKTR